MKLFYAPGACSLGIHVLLEESGRPFELAKVDLKAGEQQAEAFKAVNPKGKVPALVRDDGSVLTEFPAIAVWLARTFPDTVHLPGDPDEEARTLEILDYLVATVHMQGFSRMFRPGNFAPSEADKDAVKARGREIFTKGLDTVAERLGARPFLGGDRPSIADAALFYVAFWASGTKAAMPDAIASHFARMKARPAVARALAAEGLA